MGRKAVTSRAVRLLFLKKALDIERGDPSREVKSE